ncbi:MAG: hypothetical protein HS103_04915 [Anaerolineales bacterium]|nr:hypothetical protein [Anaerolineales bacterium]
MIIFPLAHGALGAFDEVFALLAAGVFILMFVAPTLNALLKGNKGEGKAKTTNDPTMTAPPNDDETTYRLD